MSEENAFFRPVKDSCARSIVSCAPDDALIGVVGIMREKNISSVIVIDQGAPIGIFTDRDLRNKVVAAGICPDQLKVRDVMNSPLSVIGEEELLYQALYRMSRQKIHRLGVVDPAGKLSGIITDTDILRLQAHSPHQLVLDIEKAQHLDDLKALHARIQALVTHLSGTGIPIRDLVRLIAHLNDQIVVRLIGLLRAEWFDDIDENSFAFLVLGSEGRGEQTLATDQDNAIVYADDLTPEQVKRIEEFSLALIDGLIAIGVPACKGGIMAKNADWRRSLGDWQKQLARWMGTPTPDNILACSTFIDLRTAYGSPRFEEALKVQIYGQSDSNNLFLLRMVEGGLRFTPPIGWFGKIKGESGGEHSGELEIKKAGIFAITDGIKALAVQNKMLSGSTLQRLEALRAAGIVDERDSAALDEGFRFLVLMRLRSQLQDIAEGREPDNYIRLDRLNVMEKGRLKIALTSVVKFQEFLKHHFGLHLVRG
ncbi:MAG: CBS domain-containing protein [Rhodocyclaceae bacterium]|nr:MAG: CBS domain-containing protein [Rhodocyclaceae bacterium]